MFQTFRNAWKIPELKNRLLFTLAILVVYRLGSAIPVPFITGSALNQMFSNGNMLSYLDMMSGGALSRCTLFALGVTPYINASIIVQLLTVAIPALENMAKEADGQQKMQQITRYVGGVIALVMSLGYYFVIRNMGALKYTSGAAGIFTAVVIIATFTAGKAFAQPFGRRHVERWRLVIMERTQAYIIHTSLAQRNEVRYNVYNLYGIQNSVYGRLVYHWIIVFANAKILK